MYLLYSVQQCSGSAFDIRIRIKQVKLSYKNPLFKQIFHDFRVIFRSATNSLLNKIPAGNFLVENKKCPHKFLILPLKNLDPVPYLENNLDPDP